MSQRLRVVKTTLLICFASATLWLINASGNDGAVMTTTSCRGRGGGQFADCTQRSQAVKFDLRTDGRHPFPRRGCRRDPVTPL